AADTRPPPRHGALPIAERPEDLRHRLRDHQQNSHRQRDVDEDRVFTHQRPTPSSVASTPSGKTAARAASSEPRLSSPTECPRTRSEEHTSELQSRLDLV